MSSTVTRSTVTRGTVVIDRDRCKGCELCIPACPPSVLVMSAERNSRGYRFPLLLDGCTACQACHAVCPDFVFDVYRFDEPIIGSAGRGPAADQPEDPA
ncbi:MAG: 4Fe-4S binding protein [Actinobacteria bacterium]|nr:4Fe-4S binding protein [Actinomycetota bacterium]